MTAIKKTTKTSKSPAPATKAAAAKPVVVAKPAAVAPAKPLPAATAVKSAPAVAAKGARVVTTITARVDTGFGNVLYIRGNGAGLKWDAGIPMACISNDEWQFTLSESSGPISFKLLVNDIAWSVGSDFTVAAGDRVTVTPAF